MSTSSWLLLLNLLPGGRIYPGFKVNGKWISLGSRASLLAAGVGSEIPSEQKSTGFTPDIPHIHTLYCLCLSLVIRYYYYLYCFRKGGEGGVSSGIPEARFNGG
ncbi:hypothetical protein M752DRAFT_275023 [Aspergillus phoenicis ATCC 13157]|uniref:Uncharacterized protein n=1 Tax=Aspergillus phoenicis ATCC 13157 TaxID=1353007 RepID=A0A370PNF4_ASPPH|nr:hypothetical protein M752DRAFT_275023 [Aspergillus phoenicis ATCC 13157]